MNTVQMLFFFFLCVLSCADPGIFVRGGGGVQVSLTKKALTTFFFFLVLSLFYRSQMVNFKEIYHFSRFQRGSNIFQGGGESNFFQGGGVQLLIPYRNPYNLWFSRVVRTPCPPSGSAFVCFSFFLSFFHFILFLGMSRCDEGFCILVYFFIFPLSQTFLISF